MRSRQEAVVFGATGTQVRRLASGETGPADGAPCFDAGAHSGESAISEHLGCLEARLYHSLNALSPDAQALAARARQQQRFDDAIRAELIGLDVRTRMGDSVAAKQELLLLLHRVEAGSALAGRIKMVLSTTCDRLGERTEAGRWIRDALADWPEGQQPGWRAEALMVSALNGLSRHHYDYALVHHAVAEVTEHGNAFLLASTLANFAEVSAECGDLSASAQFADSAIALLRRHPELTAPLTLDSIARSRLALGELLAARYCLLTALELEETLRCTDVQGDPWLTFAEVELASGDPAAAWQLLEHPRRQSWASKCSWTHSRELKLRAEILAELGRWQEAYQAIVQHLAMYEGLRSVEGDRVLAEFNTAQIAAEERRRAAEFEKLALTDSLTGLPNRRRAERWLASLGERPVSLAIIDLDHFKRINDEHSHDAGDEVLRRVGRLLADCGSGSEILLARLGGEEFVQLRTDADRAAAITAAQRLLAELRALPLDEVAPGLRITASVGIAFGNSADPSALLRAADQCLYEAKRAGRDQLIVTD
ncbi:MAG TPA: GGDEF domain-containing protein [Jatrophihabitans sp.]|nr:GGDEF domain-containing protein [Jatrophihabitans sp.]